MSSTSATENRSRAAWSLTLRLSVFVSLAITAIVLGVSSMMYAELVRQLHEREKAELMDDLRIQRDTLEALAHRGVASSLWRNEWREYQEAYQKFAWQLLAPDRSLRTASPNAAGFGALLPSAAPAGKFMRVDGGSRQRSLLVFDLPVDTQGPEAIELSGPALGAEGTVLRGMLDVTQNQRLLGAYRNKLALVICAAVILSALAGWLLARRGLAPLRAITGEIGRINAEKLHARIARDSWPAELHSLAGSFDDMLARLEQSFEQLTRFSSDIAHEFRSPVNNLVAAASVTLARARTPAEYQNTLEVVVEEGGRLSRMVASMLFLARADNADEYVHPEPLLLADEFRKLAEFYEIVAEEQGITLVNQGGGELLADPLLLRRALSNLLSNAMRYTPRGGSVRLGAEHGRDAVRISVSDNGAGIAAEHLPFLFDRFYRADASRSSTDSTGLGLAVVRSIVELHGGSATVASVLGQGSTFTLVFPQAPGRHAPAPKTSAEPSATS
jgi:two-component system heavy metal sensor histidine kinase CusS